MHALVLHAQHHHDVGALDRGVDRRGHAHAQAIEAGRHERRRTADPDVGAHLRQQQRVRSQHAAVREVADDRDAQAAQPALALAAS